MLWQIVLLNIDIVIFFAYQMYYIVISTGALLQFTEKGIVQAIITIWLFLEWFVNDYDGFIAAFQ